MRIRMRQLSIFNVAISGSVFCQVAIRGQFLKQMVKDLNYFFSRFIVFGHLVFFLYRNWRGKIGWLTVIPVLYLYNMLAPLSDFLYMGLASATSANLVIILSWRTPYLLRRKLLAPVYKFHIAIQKDRCRIPQDDSSLTH